MEIPRYLVNFNHKNLDKEFYDVIVIGSGIAGIYTTLCLPENLKIAIITKGEIDKSNSVLAQGGIAVSLGKEDSPELHFKDTINAGAGLCNEEAVKVLVNNAKENIKQVCNYGVQFDKEAEDNFRLSKEAAHSKKRIIHVGDATGKEVCSTLANEVIKRDNIKVFEKVFAIDIITRGDVCKGVLASKEGKITLFISNVVICASGGFGELYTNTTNPEVATGDGMAMAYRAGAELMDLEFVQFHPTVLFHPDNKKFLISEAVRGEGAVLKNKHGKRFMLEYHEMAELAPRDVVSRAIFNELKNTCADHVFLDITFKDEEYLKNRFPTIFNTCLDYGINIARDYIPVAPAEHYCMGGIRTDCLGRTKIKGLFACGEVACTGLHGANRLASNSLLEGLVYGKNIAKEVEKILLQKSKVNIAESYMIQRIRNKTNIKSAKNKIKDSMNLYVGIIRDKEGLMIVKDIIENYFDKVIYEKNEKINQFEFQNMLLISWLMINSAIERKESRGSHFRKDFPILDDLNWKKNIIVSRGKYIC